MMGLGWTEFLILMGVLVLLFGSARLPGLMRSMGRSVTEFKAGMNDKPADPQSVEDKSDSDNESGSGGNEKKNEATAETVAH